MRIALDALPLVSSRMTGIGYCEAGQVQAMMMLHPEEQYVLQFFDKGDGAEKRKRLYYYEQQRNVSVRQGHFSGYLFRCRTVHFLEKMQILRIFSIISFRRGLLESEL